MKFKDIAIVVLLVIFTPIILMSISMLSSSISSLFVKPEAPKIEIITTEKKETPVVEESKKKEEPVVESFDNRFTSDVRDVNNENYNSYVFGGKISK